MEINLFGVPASLIINYRATKVMLRKAFPPKRALNVLSCAQFPFSLDRNVLRDVHVKISLARYNAEYSIGKMVHWAMRLALNTK